MIGVRHRNGRVIHGVGLQRVWVPWRDPPCLCAFDADPGSYVRNGSGVSRWNDITGHGYHALQPTALNQPTWTESDADFRGHGSLSFAYSHKLISSAFALQANQPLTIYAVCKPNITGSAGVLFDGLAGHRLYTASYSAVTAANSNGVGVVSTGNYNNVAIVYCLVANGASSAMYFSNFTTPDGAGSIGSDYMAGISIGCDASGGTMWKGKIASLMLFSGAHSIETRRKIGGCLGSKYGIATS